MCPGSGFLINHWLFYKNKNKKAAAHVIYPHTHSEAKEPMDKIEDFLENNLLF